MAAPFMIALRGYDMGQVDAALQQADDALASGSETLRAAARSALEGVEFRERFRGYARHEVNQTVEERLQQLA